MRRAGLALVLALLALAPLGSARAATTTRLYAGSVTLDTNRTFVVLQLHAGDVVTGTFTPAMDPIPRGSWFWFTYLSDGNGHTSTGQFDPIPVQFTATADGPLTIGSIGTGKAYYLLTVSTRTHTVPPVATVPASALTPLT
jgi:hypothetical protein